MSAESERIRRELGFGLIEAERVQSARNPVPAMHPNPSTLSSKEEVDRALREGVVPD